MKKFLVKAFYFFSKKFLVIIFGVFVPIIYFLNKKKNYYFFELEATRFGSFASGVEPFIRKNENDLKKNKNNIYLLYISNYVANKFLLKLFIKKMRESKNIIFLKGYFFWQFIFFSYKFWTKREDIRFHFADLRKNYFIYNSHPPILKLSSKEIENGYEILEKLGIKKNSKWICIHNRDSAYLNQTYLGNDWSYHDYRDFSINDFELASEYFVKKGYHVIRMGKLTNEKMSSKNPMIIDYVNSNLKSDFVDIFLMSNCKFYFGSPSGVVNVVMLFRKPLFVINLSPMEGIFSYERKYPCLFKRAYDLKKKRLLTIREMVEQGLLHVFSTETYKKKNIKLISNSSEEILTFAIEAEARIAGSWKTNCNDFEEHSKKFIDEINKDPIVKKMYFKNKIGQEFLRETKLF